MITKEEYIYAQRMSRVGYKRNYQSQPVKYLVGKIIDAKVPGIEYKQQIISGKNNKYLRFVVDPKHKKSIENEELRKKLKIIKAKDIISALDNLFQQLHKKYTEKHHKEFVKAIRQHIEEESFNRAGEIKRLKTIETKAKNEYNDLLENYLTTGRDYSKSEKALYNKKKESLENEIKGYNEEIAFLIQEENKMLPAFENFLNTLKTLAKSYKTMSGVRKLEIADLIVLNTLVHDGKVLEIQLKEPFDKLFDSSGDPYPL